jgi:hypothetical protein
MSYYCKYCNFESKIISYIKQHIYTKKHKMLSHNDIDIKNYNKIMYKCEECCKFYNTKSNLQRHIKTRHLAKCHGVYKKIDINSTYDMLDMLEDTDDKTTRLKLISVMKLVLDKDREMAYKDRETAEKIKDIYETENEYHKKVAVNAGQIVNKTMNMLTYAVQNFKETPQLEMLDSKTARKLLKYESSDGKPKNKLNDDQTAEYIAKITEAKSLPKHLGNVLVNHYKKDDPNHQSLWTTDASRMKFIIKIGDKWKKDETGSIMNNNIISPLLKEVTSVMDKYCREKSANIGNMSTMEENRYVEVVEQSLNIKSDIKSSKLNKAIIKYMTPCFLMQKQIEQ